MLGVLLELTPSYRQTTARVNSKSANCSQKMPIFSVFRQSAIASIGCQRIMHRRGAT
jgi:hypothetical protein